MPPPRLGQSARTFAPIMFRGRSAPSPTATPGAIPMRDKFNPGEPRQTKLALRRAFAGSLPPAVLARTKASFPLPFELWIEDMRTQLCAPGPALEMLRADALKTIAARPGELWRAAWPVVNLVLWARRWWG